MPASSQPLVLRWAEAGRQPASFTGIPPNGPPASSARKEEKKQQRRKKSETGQA